MKIVVGQGSCGIAAGAGRVYDALAQALSGTAHELTIAGCIGMCYLEPIVDIYEESGALTRLVRVQEKDVPTIAKAVETGDQSALAALMITDDDKAFLDQQTRIALRHCGVINPEKIEDYLADGGYSSIRKALASMAPEDVIETIKVSGLKGRGGAGFPTWFKWNAARKEQAQPKYLICNADEGDPGAFMDRAVIEGDPHNLIEGMLIAAYAIGASEMVVYVRAEYPLAVKRLRNAIRMPRLKPPFPAASGYWHKPSNINNVETFANVPWILLNGGEAFASMGTPDSKGTKVFALTGKIKKGGLVEIPMGKTLRDVIFGIGGGIRGDREFKAVQMGGPSGGCIPAEKLDTIIDYKALGATGAIMGSGGMVVMDETTCMVEMARFFLDFTAKESCGKCVHCRLGTKRMLEILTRIVNGEGKEGDVELLEELCASIKDGALCGLGQTAPNPVLTTIRYFRKEYEAHIREKKCPAHQCAALISYRIDPDVCTGCTLCARNCPVKAISGEVKKPHVIDPEICIKCGKCKAACRFGAVLVD